MEGWSLVKARKSLWGGKVAVPSLELRYAEDCPSRFECSSQRPSRCLIAMTDICESSRISRSDLEGSSATGRPRGRERQDRASTRRAGTSWGRRPDESSTAFACLHLVFLLHRSVRCCCTASPPYTYGSGKAHPPVAIHSTPPLLHALLHMLFYTQRLQGLAARCQLVHGFG